MLELCVYVGDDRNDEKWKTFFLAVEFSLSLSVFEFMIFHSTKQPGFYSTTNRWGRSELLLSNSTHETGFNVNFRNLEFSHSTLINKRKAFRSSRVSSSFTIHSNLWCEIRKYHVVQLLCVWIFQLNTCPLTSHHSTVVVYEREREWIRAVVCAGWKLEMKSDTTRHHWKNEKGLKLNNKPRMSKLPFIKSILVWLTRLFISGCMVSIVSVSSEFRMRFRCVSVGTVANRPRSSVFNRLFARSNRFKLLSPSNARSMIVWNEMKMTFIWDNSHDLFEFLFAMLEAWKFSIEWNSKSYSIDKLFSLSPTPCYGKNSICARCVRV